MIEGKEDGRLPAIKLLTLISSALRLEIPFGTANMA